MFHRASAKPPGFVCFVTDLVLASGTPMSAPSMYLGGGVGGEGAGGSGHALAAVKYSLNTYKRV